MTVLNCDVKNCYFNKSSKCCKDGIQIEVQMPQLWMPHIVKILEKN